MHKYEIITHQVINSRKPGEDRDCPILLISIVCLQFPSSTDWSILVCSKTKGRSEHIKFVHSGYECLLCHGFSAQIGFFSSQIGCQALEIVTIGR